MICGEDSQDRKECPVYSGFMRYFPDAMAAVARLSWRGNDQHNPGEPLHWAREKSGDELDALVRHILEEDWDAVAWRAMANLQKKIEQGWKHEKKDCTPTKGVCEGSVQSRKRTEFGWEDCCPDMGSYLSECEEAVADSQPTGKTGHSLGDAAVSGGAE